MEDEFEGLDLAGQVALLRRHVHAHRLAVSALGHAVRESHAREVLELIELHRRMAEVCDQRGRPSAAESFRISSEILLGAIDADETEPFVV